MSIIDQLLLPNLSLAERDDKFRTTALAGFYPGAAAVPLGNLAHDGESSTRPFDIAPYSPLEKLKYPLGMLTIPIAFPPDPWGR